jgi:hypothetical protein
VSCWIREEREEKKKKPEDRKRKSLSEKMGPENTTIEGAGVKKRDNEPPTTPIATKKQNK